MRNLSSDRFDIEIERKIDQREKMQRPKGLLFGSFNVLTSE